MELEVTSLGNRVGGIARPADGPAVFIPGALPGERVLVRITCERKSHLEAELVEILRTCPERTEPFCPLFGRCGGCSLQHLDYRSQLYWKRQWILKAFREFKDLAPEEVLPSDEGEGFRNRVTFHAAHGRPCLHEFRGDPFPVPRCPALADPGNRVLEEVWKTGIPGGVDTLAIRCSRHTGASRVEIEGAASELPESWGPSCGPAVKSSGKPMVEKLLEWLFPVPPGGFFQVNTAASEKLLKTVMDNSSGERVLDLFGGAGTFGVPLAGRGARVDSVEISPAASGAGEEAAAMNGVKGFRAFRLRDRSFLSRALSEGWEYDEAVVDPPRAGAGIRTMRALRRLAPARVIYISCNPFTAARDVKVLAGGGYGLMKALPVDMFPQTDHVETVLILERTGK